LIHKYDPKAAAVSHSKIQGLADAASKFASELTKDKIAEYFAPVVAVPDDARTVSRGQLGDHEDGKSVWSVKTGVTLKVRGGRGGDEREEREERTSWERRGRWEVENYAPYLSFRHSSDPLSAVLPIIHISCSQ
jgi:hypothetical protein